MQLLISRISNPVEPYPLPGVIKNIIFDFGGVICNIDVALTEHAFKKLGMTGFDKKQSITDTKGLFERFEIGSLSPDQFRQEIRRIFNQPLTDQQIDHAWNALLLDIPPYRIRLLEKLRENYRIFLLSNSNQIHYDKYRSDLEALYGYENFGRLFEKAYFSFEIGLKKPHRVIFDYILEESNLAPNETLFIDDTYVHVQGANQAGIHGHFLNLSSGESISDLFS